ncbi:MAG: hypothetical protein OSJ28_08745 [Desulfovibrio sp.]|jgi:hypothetical protein|nr:hypothetical protein [Desulfovibrio sp.]
MRSVPLPPILLWQVWPIFALCGIFGAIWPLESAICALLPIILDKRLQHASRIFLALGFFLAGYCVCHHFIGREKIDTPP